MKNWVTHPIKVTLLGRVNVGKTAIFNKLADASSKAIVAKEPGTTRDTNEAVVRWQGISFTLVDTGGWQEVRELLNQQIAAATKKALTESWLNILIGEASYGPLPEDKQISKLIKKAGRPHLLVVNKTDKKMNALVASEWHALSLGEPMLVSALNGRGLGDLLDAIVKLIPIIPAKTLTPITVGLIGKPNVGKSTLINAFAGKEKMIVADEPHTTREPRPIHVKLMSHDWIFFDTAGLRKKRKRVGFIEKEGGILSLKIAETADMNLLLIDSSEHLTSQDKTLASKLTDTDRGLIIVANKWDLTQQKNSKTVNRMTHLIEANFSTLKWAKIHFVSALTKQGLIQLEKSMLALYDKSKTVLSEIELRRFLENFAKKYPAPGADKKKRKIMFLKLEHIAVNPLTFELNVRAKENLPRADLNLFSKQLRKHFSFEGLPIRIKVKYSKI